MTQKIGLEAVLDLTGFNGAMGDYISSVQKMEEKTGAAAVGAVAMGTVLGDVLLRALYAARDAALDFVKSITDIVTESTGIAARISELEAVLGLLGKRAGWSAEDIEMNAEAIKKLGIRSDVALGLIAQFARYQLDAADATKLARVAQDAAVLSMRDSSDALERLTHGILTQSTVVLRNAGVMVNVDKALQTYAASLGKARNELTEAERVQAVLNAVIEEGGRIAGAYTTAMEEPGKALRSLARHFYEAKASIGEQFLPAMGLVVDYATRVATGLRSLLEEGEPLNRIFDALGQTVQVVLTELIGLGTASQGWIYSALETLASAVEKLPGTVGAALPQIHEALSKLGDVVGFIVENFDLFKTVIVGFATAQVILHLPITLGNIATAIGMVGKALTGSVLAINPVLAGLALLGGAIAGLVVHYNRMGKQARETAAEILETAETYEDYTEKAEKAGVGSRLLSEELFNVYKAAAQAGDGIDALQFQEATEGAKRLLLRLDALENNMTGGYVNEYGYEVEGTGWSMDALRGQVEQMVQGASELEVKMLSNRDTVREWGIELGKSGSELDDFVDVVTQSARAEYDLTYALSDAALVLDEKRAAVEDYKKAARETTPVIEELGEATEDSGLSAQEAAEQMQHYAETLENNRHAIIGVVENISDAWGSHYTKMSEIQITGEENLKETDRDYQDDRRAMAQKHAEKLLELQQKHESDLAEALTSGNTAKAAKLVEGYEERRSIMEGKHSAEFSALASKYGKEREQQATANAQKLADQEADYAAALGKQQEHLARLLLNELDTLLAMGRISRNQYAEMRLAIADEYGFLLNDQERYTGQMLGALRAWAMGMGVPAGEVVGYISNIESKYPELAAAAEAATYRQMLSWQGLSKEMAYYTGAITSSILNIPDDFTVQAHLENDDEVKRRMQEIADAMNNIPREVWVTTHLTIDGDPSIMPQSPHTMLEYALQNIAKAARDVRDLRVSLHGDMAPPFTNALSAGSGSFGGTSHTTHNTVNLSMPATISNGMDAATFQAQVLQTVRRAVRGY